MCFEAFSPDRKETILKKAALHNLGCKVNAYETEAMRELLIEDGYEIVPFSEKADVYVINTCTVTAIADHKSRQMINRAKNLNQDAVIVAAGCYVQTHEEEAGKLPCDIIIGNNRKQDLIKEIHSFLESRERKSDIEDINTGAVGYEPLRVKSTEEHTRAFLKIEDGCNQFCSYCLIPFARGRVRSRNVESVVSEARHFAKLGYKEVVLTGINLSSYGEGTDLKLIDVIEGINAIDGIKRIRLGSIEPRIISREFAERAGKLEKLCPHFHLSLQSGCDATLKRMNRKYTASEFKEGTELLREFFPDPALTTDVIVGFPGETDKEFEESLEFYKDINFYEMHVFKFSRREGTRAFDMPDQVSERVKTKRSHVLLSLTKENSRKYREKEIGKELPVLFEEVIEIDGRPYWTGFTDNYIRAAVEKDAEELFQGQGKRGLSDMIIKGKVKGLLPGSDLILLDRSSLVNVE